METQPLPADTIARDFLTFCRSKPADERYEYCAPSRCALSQFSKLNDHPELVGLAAWEIEDALGPDVDNALAASDTFGQLTRRLEAALELAA